jgi:putative ABC transport system ATP-binding protein
LTEDVRPLFEFRDVSMKIGGQHVLRHLSLLVPESGVTVILGPSGSGKTTLLRMCNRLSLPTSGSVLFRGENIARCDPLALRREVGMVFQRPTALPGSVRDNLTVADSGADGARMTATLERVGLDDSFLGRTARELSGGELQRVCLARTLLACPSVLLLDEPTTALDVNRRLDFERLAREFAGDGVPVVWVTHDLDQAHRLGDVSIVLVEGRLGSEDEARAFLEREAQDEGTDDARN